MWQTTIKKELFLPGDYGEIKLNTFIQCIEIKNNRKSTTDKKSEQLTKTDPRSGNLCELIMFNLLKKRPIDLTLVGHFQTYSFKLLLVIYICPKNSIATADFYVGGKCVKQTWKEHVKNKFSIS